MNLGDLFRESFNVKFSAVYDMAENSFSLRWREHYEDPEEAEFFGNQVLEGQSLGLLSYGVTGFKTSIQDHVCLGKLRSLEIEKIYERIAVKLEYMHESRGTVHVSFTCLNVYLEVFRHNQVVRHTVSVV